MIRRNEESSLRDSANDRNRPEDSEGSAPADL
jgi:hypothetical protein